MLYRMPSWQRRRWRPRVGGRIDWSTVRWWLLLKGAAIFSLLRGLLP